MAKDDKGPHYIPDLDPHGEKWRPGDGGRKTLWLSFLVSLIAFLLAIVAFYFGFTEAGVGLIVLGLIIMIPIMVGVTIF